MADTIKHQGIVENINGTHLQVRIVQTSACAACSIKGHCTSADAKEKLIDVTMGVMAVLLAFVVPFLVLVVSLFVFMAIWNDELGAALGALFLLVPYYFILWLNKSRLGKKFSFSIQPMN